MKLLASPRSISAGVGQEPQTPALAPHPIPAQNLSLYSLSNWYKISGRSGVATYSSSANNAMEAVRVENSSGPLTGEVLPPSAHR